MASQAEITPSAPSKTAAIGLAVDMGTDHHHGALAPGQIEAPELIADRIDLFREAVLAEPPGEPVARLSVFGREGQAGHGAVRSAAENGDGLHHGLEARGIDPYGRG